MPNLLVKNFNMNKKNQPYYPTEEFKKKAWASDPAIYEKAEKDPIKFWEELAEQIVWREKWQKAFEHKPPYFKWFLGGKLNITETCLDKNLQKNKDKTALIWQPEPTEEKCKTLSYQELFEEVNRFANALKKMGVKKGDRVGIYLPMIPEVVISMLACARIGAVHAVVFSAYSPMALQTRLMDSEAEVLITSDGYYRNGSLINLKNNTDEGIKDTSVKKIIVVKRAGNEISWDENRDIWWHELVKEESTECLPEIMDAEDPFFILYTSGSTGKPKGVLHACGGYAVQAYATARLIFDLKDDDVFWCIADMGWITGHTYNCYGLLLNGATFMLFEGLLFWPEPDRWAKIIDEKNVSVFYTAPTAIRMCERYGADILKKYNFEKLRLLGSVGEPIDESAWLWFFNEVGRKKCPIVDTWWQTETGGILITSLPGIGPFRPAFTGLPFPGIKCDILNEKGESCKTGETGNLVILPPFSPGMLRGLYKNPEKYLETYWSQYTNEIYFTSDAGLKDEKGLIRVIGRVDDVIKVAGHRLSTGEMESVINSHEGITECAVIGIPDEIKGEVPVIFIIYKDQRPAEDVKKEVLGYLKKEIGPIALPKEIYLVEDLPKTRSGKIMRRILRRLFTKEELGDLSTLANPESVEKIKASIKQ